MHTEQKDSLMPHLGGANGPDTSCSCPSTLADPAVPRDTNDPRNQQHDQSTHIKPEGELVRPHARKHPSPPIPSAVAPVHRTTSDTMIRAHSSQDFANSLSPPLFPVV